MGDKGVDQGPVRIAGGGMDNQTGWFVDHNQVVVLVNDIEWDILSHRRGRNGGRDFNFVMLARFDPVIGVFYRDVAASRDLCHAAFIDQLAQTGAAHVGAGAGQVTVQPLSGLGVGNDEFS